MTLGVIGYGQFGRFLTPHLGAAGEVRTYDINGTGSHSLEEVCASDVVVFAVPVQNLEEACRAAVPHVSPTALIADVSSVKVKPLAILTQHFSNHELLGTHPIFGPQSGKDGVAGLPIVLTNVSWTSEHYTALVDFLKNTLALKVIERTPEAHDREMARVQGLAHFIGRALNALDVTDYETSTKSYHHLVELRSLLKDDSWELFVTIQNENPFAAEVREEFLAALNKLEDGLAAT